VPLFLKVQNIFFFIAPPFSVIFCAGLLWRRASSGGALWTIALGFVFSLLFDRFIKGQQGVYLHRAFFTWCFCVLVMVVASLLTAAPAAEKVEPIIWSPSYAVLPEEDRKRYRGIRDWRIWWLLFVGIILGFTGFSCGFGCSIRCGCCRGNLAMT
jgi:Na+/proline symporter